MDPRVLKPIPGRGEILDVLDQKTSLRTAMDKSIHSGDGVAFVVRRIGDLTLVWGTTGRIAATAKKTIYLTDNGEVGGKSLFTYRPLAIDALLFTQSAADNSQLARADVPPDETQSIQLSTASGYQIDVENDIHYRTWRMVVTNLSGTKDYAFSVMGV